MSRPRARCRRGEGLPSPCREDPRQKACSRFFRAKITTGCRGIACFSFGATNAMCRRRIPRATTAWRVRRFSRKCRFLNKTFSEYLPKTPMRTGLLRSTKATLKQFFAPPAGRLPQFDLVLLGMGPDGHTASLFPQSKGLREKQRLVIANWVEKFSTDRITFTAPLLNAARVVEFLVAGADKAPALREVLEGNASPDLYPSKMIRPGTASWFGWWIRQQRLV